MIRVDFMIFIFPNFDLVNPHVYCVNAGFLTSKWSYNVVSGCILIFP